jgi:hypothetical protein
MAERTPEWLTLAQAAEELGVQAGTLRVQANAGRLHARKVGHLWVVSPGELERYRAQSLGQRRGGRRARALHFHELASGGGSATRLACHADRHYRRGERGSWCDVCGAHKAQHAPDSMACPP